MRIASIIDISLVDVPGIPVTVLFTGGCNFDCPYCQNAGLIPSQSGREMSIDEIVEKSRGHLSEGYCITGGEPTIHPDLPDLLRALGSEVDKHVNLNTQGSVPSVLQKCIPYLDSVWFDIKTNPPLYTSITRTTTNPWNKVRQSIQMLMDSEVAFWPRTTYADVLMSPSDIIAVSIMLKDLGYQGEYVVQNYMPSEGVRPSEREYLRVPEKEALEGILNNIPKDILLRLDWR